MDLFLHLNEGSQLVTLHDSEIYLASRAILSSVTSDQPT
jgi:hypothetical protein